MLLYVYVTDCVEQSIAIIYETKNRFMAIAL